jgi:hypothetical protein
LPDRLEPSSRKLDVSLPAHTPVSLVHEANIVVHVTQEITMEATNLTAARKGAKWDIPRIGRLFVFIFSAGFLCPNVWIEGMDLMTLHDKNDAGIAR